LDWIKNMIKIEQPYCDWVSLASKDARRAAIWLCKECGHREKRKQVPDCPCKTLAITSPEDK
jgi:ABC-type ATPase with predicted acetyltransferase domain